MKNILMIGTGGTIASDISDQGLVPELSSEQLLEAIPTIANICNVTCIQQYNLDSTNIEPSHWLGIAKTIQDNYDMFDGFVICHGTDTMAYTASALSYLIQNSSKPIILTGAQKPIWFDGTDSKQNLTDSFIYACKGCGGVQIVFNGKVILGTRARKTYSKSFKAFDSVNYPTLAVLQDSRLLQYIKSDHRGKPKFYSSLNTNIGLLKLVPGIKSDVVKYMIDNHDGLIIESFGVGGLPEYSDLFGIINHAVKRGKILIMTTQVPFEGSDLAVYHVGGKLKNSVRLLEAYDMTTESAYAKLMWIMGQTTSFEQIEKLFYTPVSQDILRFNS